MPLNDHQIFLGPFFLALFVSPPFPLQLLPARRPKAGLFLSRLFIAVWRAAVFVFPRHRDFISSATPPFPGTCFFFFVFSTVAFLFRGPGPIPFFRTD